MITPTTITEQLLFTTVRIESECGVGTGFFFNATVDGSRTLPLIVTNKHVVQGSLRGSFQLHEADLGSDPLKPSGRFFPVDLGGFESRWIPHPDPKVDLCAMPFQPLRGAAEEMGKVVFYKSFDENLILSEDQLRDIAAAEDVLLVGYPIGLWDEKNNVPLIRRGITASHPALDFQGKPEFVIDAACFPGSSGSPVVLANLGSYLSRDGSLVVGTRFALLGVLYAGPQRTVEGSIEVRPIPTAVVATVQVPMMVHLGYVIKAREVVTLAKHILEEARRKGSL